MWFAQQWSPVAVLNCLVNASLADNTHCPIFPNSPVSSERAKSQDLFSSNFPALKIRVRKIRVRKAKKMGGKCFWNLTHRHLSLTLPSFPSFPTSLYFLSSLHLSSPPLPRCQLGVFYMTAKLSVWYACWGGKQHLAVADKCTSFLMTHVMAYMERWPIKRKKEVEIL